MWGKIPTALCAVVAVAVLQNMLAQDPQKRPSAEELLKVVSKAVSKSGLPLAASGAAAAAVAAVGSPNSRRSL